jgi:hypothetical protein
MMNDDNNADLVVGRRINLIINKQLKKFTPTAKP